LWPGRGDESALHATEQFSFDLILLDLMLPGISGFEVCQQLRQRDHTVTYDRDGHQSWASVFEGKAYASPKAIAVDSRGRVHVAGLIVRGFNSSFAVVAYDAGASELWNHVVQGMDHTRDWTAAAAAIDRQGRLRVTGGTLDMLDWGLIDSWYLTNMYSASGDLLWARGF